MALSALPGSLDYPKASLVSLPYLPLDSGLSQASSHHSLEAGYIVSVLYLYWPIPSLFPFGPTLPSCDTSVFPSPQCDAESDLDEKVSRARTCWVGSFTACITNSLYNELKVFLHAAA